MLKLSTSVSKFNLIVLLKILTKFRKVVFATMLLHSIDGRYAYAYSTAVVGLHYASESIRLQKEIRMHRI